MATCALAPAMAWAQATSQIQGIVSDATGSALPGVEVRATQTDTGFVRTTSSGADGTYVLANLPIGPYRLEATKEGFATYAQTGLALQVNSNPTINISLQVGAVTQTIEVEADAPLAEVQNTSIGALVDNRRIVELPLNGRNPVELIQLVGAAVPAGRAGTAGMPGGLNISVAGGSVSGIGYQLDGTMYNNLFDAVNLPFPFPDALQEFKVETSTMTAQNGTHASAAVSGSVKSGTNAFHGSLFEFLRNGNMNARNFFATRRDTLKRNQFGGTIGGPIVIPGVVDGHDNLFFFAGYQGTLTRSDPADLTAFVPTDAMKAGDFSRCSTFPATIRDPQGGTFPGKQIPVSRFNPQSLAAMEFLPSSADPCGRAPYGPIQQINEHQFLGRVDWNINEKQQLFGRYMGTTYLLNPSYAISGNILDSTSGGLDDLAQTWAMGHTYVISPTVVNSFRAAANRVAVLRFNDDYFSGCSLGVRMYCFVPSQTVLTVTGGFNVGIGTAIQASFIPTYYTISDDVSMVRGSHQLAFGFTGFKYQHSQKANVFSASSFNFNGVASGLGMADFFLGQMSGMTQGSPNTTFTYKWGVGLYAQDTWKVSRRLTLNYGVRWEPFLPQGINNGAVYNFDYAKFQAGVRSTVFPLAAPGLVYDGDPGFQAKTGVNKRWNQFAPRVGIAFDPSGDGKMSIRASGGISYDFPNIQIMSTPTTAPPFGNTITIPGPINFSDPFATYPGGNPFPGTFGPNSPFIPFGTYVAQQPDAKGPTIYTWNMSVQRQLGSDWLASVSYVGSQSVHVWVSKMLNAAIVTPGANTANTNQRRILNLQNPTAQLGPVDQFESGGVTSYHGMILSLNKRMTQGVSFNVNYTWGHCIGDITIGSLVGGAGGTYMDQNDRRRDRGNCSTPTLDGNQTTDRRHIFNLTAVLESPRFENNLWRAIASNWRLSPSYRYLSSGFLSVGTGIDFALNGSAGNQRANQLLGDVYCANRDYNCWVNPAAYGQPANGTFGNSGRANVAGPTYFQIDAALSRIFRLNERTSLEARGEAFNLTNSTRFNNPVTARNNNNFGKILTALDPRIMQVALKLVF